MGSRARRTTGRAVVYLILALYVVLTLLPLYWIFTTTFQGQRKLFDDAFDACPFMSRAIELTLEHGEDVVLAFAVRARRIAQTEHLDGLDLDDYVRLVRGCGCNMRKVLQQIEAGEMLAD